MKQLTLFYRKLKELNNAIGENQEAQAFLNAIVNSNNDKDSFEAERTYCVIDEKWVQKIEQELVYVAKAIEEDRQFIIKNGEVVNIEKIKKVSPDTVRHLARHSSLITREPDSDGNIEPDKLYMVENLTDFAVYENRFLYMLLCYLRDFISLRLSQINEVCSTYTARLKIKKDLVIKKRRFIYSVDLYDKDKRDRFSHLFSNCQAVVERINDQYHNVLSLLNTPLMKEVSKAPLLKPPITKTNVLKMNNNFVHAMELYHYVSSYVGKGFTVEKISNSFTPPAKQIMTEMASIISLTSFLAYKYGNKFWQMIEEECIREDAELKEQEKLKLRDQVLALKSKLDKSNQSYLEYALKLEERNAALEGVFDSLQRAQKDLELSRQREDRLKSEIEKLKNDLAYQKTVADENMKKFREKDFEYQDKILDLDQSKARLQDEYDKKFNQIAMQIDEEVSKIRGEMENEFGAKLDQIKGEISTSSREEKERALAEANEEYSEKRRQIEFELSQAKNLLNEKINEFNALKQEYNENTAQLIGLRLQHGLSAPLEDYTSQARFTELEEQFEFFAKFFKEQWAKTKKRIRKEILWKSKAEGDDKK